MERTRGPKVRVVRTQIQEIDLENPGQASTTTERVTVRFPTVSLEFGNSNRDTRLDVAAALNYLKRGLGV